MHLLEIFSVLPSVTCKRHFHANISCKCSKCRLLPFSQTVAPLLPPQSQPPPFAFIQSFLASYFSPCSPPHTRSSIQPSQPPTHSLGMNRSEKRSHASSDARRSFWIRLPWMWRNFFFPLEGVQNAVQSSKLLAGQFRGVMCLTCASKAEARSFSPFHFHEQSSCSTLCPPSLSNFINSTASGR